ncbi:MAG: hypothetical protein ACXWQQ_05375 [Pseudobdellovibrio sp.]
MNCSFTKILKAAISIAAFLFFQPAQAISSLDNIKNKSAELLALHQKDKAIQLIINYSGTERSKAYKAEASELLFNVAQSFMSLEAQEEYESSVNDTLDNEKNSLKAAERCLKIEAQNLSCLIQQARIYYRLKNDKNLASTVNDIKALLVNSSYENLFQLFVDHSSPDFKNKQIIGVLPTQPNDRTLFYVILETDRSFEAKNYSRAREVLTYAEKNYPDWPDLAFYKNRLNIESSEKQAKPDDDLISLYSNKCKSISHSLARKYRYDFELCSRGKK